MLKVPTYGSWLVMSAQGYDTPEELISSENQKAFCVKFREFVRPGVFKFHEFLTKRGKRSVRACFQTMTDLKIGAEQLDGKVSCSDVFSKSYVYSCPT